MKDDLRFYPDYKGPMQKITFDTDPRAPTIDQIHDAIMADRLVAQSHIHRLFNAYVKKFKGFPVEVFTFGTLPIELIQDAQKDAIDFVKHKVFTMPYDTCMYRVSLKYPDGVVIGTTLLNVSIADGTDAGVGTISFTRDRSAGMVPAVHSINRLEVVDDGDPEGRGVMLELPKAECEFWAKTMMDEHGTAPSKEQLSNGSMLAMGLTMILNTKGVHKDRHEPPAKPNAMRAKKGRPLLPYVTRVYTSAYARSTTDPNEVTKGTHASPRPHRRRAHVRHYVRGNREWWTPVEAMLVNWDGKPLGRGEYVVSGDDHEQT